MKNEIVSISNAILATLLYIVGTSLISFWFYIPEAFHFENYYDYFSVIDGALQLIAIFIFIYFIENKTLKNLIKNTNYKWYLFAFLLGILFVFMQTPLNWIYNFLFGTDYNIIYRFDGLAKFQNVNVISTILLIPIAEEIFFREYIQSNLQKNTSQFVAILVAALLFASIHSPYLNLIFEESKQNWHHFYLTIVGGIISGVLYFKSKSLGPSISFHMFWNIMVVIV